MEGEAVTGAFGWGTGYRAAGYGRRGQRKHSRPLALHIALPRPRGLRSPWALPDPVYLGGGRYEGGLAPGDVLPPRPLPVGPSAPEVVVPRWLIPTARRA